MFYCILLEKGYLTARPAGAAGGTVYGPYKDGIGPYKGSIGPNMGGIGSGMDGIGSVCDTYRDGMGPRMGGGEVILCLYMGSYGRICT